MHMTVKDGVRWSTANAYLRPALRRSNLKVETKALTHRVVLEGRRGDGSGVRARRADAPRPGPARGDPVGGGDRLAGDPAALRDRTGRSAGRGRRGAAPRSCPEWARTCRTTSRFTTSSRCKQPITLNGKIGVASRMLIGARWLLRKDGLGATNHFESCGFIRSRAGLRWPDIQYHFMPAAYVPSNEPVHALRPGGMGKFPGHGYQVHVGPNKPKSRGRVNIRSADPRAKPSILFNYLQHEQDRVDWRATVRPDSRDHASTGAGPLSGRGGRAPGEAVRSDEEIDAWVRAAGETAYHPSSTCKMGAPLRPDGGRGPAVPGDRHRGPARRRRLDLSRDHQRQPQRPHHHERGEGRPTSSGDAPRSPPRTRRCGRIPSGRPRQRPRAPERSVEG